MKDWLLTHWKQIGLTALSVGLALAAASPKYQHAASVAWVVCTMFGIQVTPVTLPKAPEVKP